MIFVYDNVEILKVIDGDTVKAKLRVDIGFKVYAEMIKNVRLNRINAPEKDTNRGQGVKSWLEERLETMGRISIKTHKTGKYGRILGELYVDKDNINDEMLKKKLVTKYK